MEAAGLLAKVMDGPGRRLLKALAVSAILHLALALLIQPARQAGTVVLQARIASAPTRPAPPTPTVPEAALSHPPADMTPSPEGKEAPLPLPPELAPSAPQQTEPGPAAETPQPPGQGAEPAARDAETTAAGPTTGLPEVPVIADTRWYTAREVDIHPRPTRPIQPQYPEAARMRGQEGSVVLQLKIDEFGVVREIEVLESSPAGVFDQSSVEAFRAADFYPAQRGGRAVRALVKIRVTYELD
jgi:protein TonB